MVRESVAIIIIGLMFAAMFIRSKQYSYMVASLPIFFIPIAYLIGRAILYFSGGSFFGVRPPLVLAFAILVGLVASCVLIVFSSWRISPVRNQRLYQVTLLVYVVILGWVYIYNSLKVILM